MSEGEDQGVELDGRIKKMFVYELHDAPMGGSAGVNKTYKASKSHYFWASVKEEIEDYFSLLPNITDII